MNLEEAVETVLEGRAWSLCDVCKAGRDYLYCPTCETQGWLKNTVFEQACHVLGRDFPDPPPVMPSRPDRVIFPSFELQNMTAFQDIPFLIDDEKKP